MKIYELVVCRYVSVNITLFRTLICNTLTLVSYRKTVLYNM